MRVEKARYEIPISPGEHKVIAKSIIKFPKVYKDSKGKVFIIANVKAESEPYEHSFTIVGDICNINSNVKGRCIGHFDQNGSTFYVYQKMIKFMTRSKKC